MDGRLDVIPPPSSPRPCVSLSLALSFSLFLSLSLSLSLSLTHTHSLSHSLARALSLSLARSISLSLSLALALSPWPLTQSALQVGRVEISKVRALEAEDIKLLCDGLKANKTLKELTICAGLSGADAGTQDNP